MSEITAKEEAALRKCNAWENVKCLTCMAQATHDDLGHPLRGQTFFVAYCKDHVAPIGVKVAAALQPSSREAIYSDITKERDRQDAKWGGKEHDKHHTVNDWVRLIHEHSNKARAAANLGDIQEARARLVEVAAISVASLEMLDVIAAYAQRGVKK